MSKYEGHIHSIYPGTAGWGTGTHKALRIGAFDFGVGWREYGPTDGTKFWSLIDPEYSGLTAFGLGLSGQTAGVVVYQYKASQGPSIVSFTAGGATAFLNFTKAISGSAGLGTASQALDWYVGRKDSAVVTNIFKSIPNIDNLVYAWDVDQGMSVVPDKNNINIPAVTTYDLSQWNWPVTMVSGPTAGNIPQLFGPLKSSTLPYRINFNTGQCDTAFDSNPTASLSSASQFSISIWVRPQASSNNYNMFYMFDALSKYVIIFYDSISDEIRCAYDFGGGPGVISLTAPGGYTGLWQNFTIVVDGESISGYTDGGIQEGADLGLTVNFDITALTVGDFSNKDQSFQFNCVYVWNIPIYNNIPPTGYNGVQFFYQASKDAFIR